MYSVFSCIVRVQIQGIKLHPYILQLDTVCICIPAWDLGANEIHTPSANTGLKRRLKLANGQGGRPFVWRNNLLDDGELGIDWGDLNKYFSPYGVNYKLTHIYIHTYTHPHEYDSKQKIISSKYPP